MNLKSLSQDLRRILPNQQPTPEHILQAIDSLCSDIQYHCGEDIDIYSGPVQNYRVLNNYLTMLAHILCDIYDAHCEGIRKEVRVSFPDRIRTVERETRANQQLLLEQDAELTGAEAALQEARGKVAAAQNIINASDAELAHLNDELRTKNARIEIQKAQLASAKDEIPRLDQSLTKYAGRIRDLKTELDQREHDLAAAQAEESRLFKLADAAKVKKEDLDNKIAAHNRLLTQLSDVDTQIQAATANLAKARADLTTATGNRDQLQNQITAANTAAAELQEESKTLTGQLNTAYAERVKCQTERDGLNNSLSDVKRQTAELQKQSEKLRTELETASNTNTAEQEQIGQLKDKIAAAQEQLQTMRSSLYSLDQNLNLQNRQNEDYRVNTLVPAEAALEKARELHTQQTAELARLEGLQKSLEGDLTNINSDIIKVGDHTESLKRDLEEKSVNLSKTKMEHEAVKSRLREINDEIARRANASKEMKQAIADKQELLKKNDPDVLRARNDSIMEELDEQLAKANQLKMELNTKTAELNAARKNCNHLLGQKAHIEEEFGRISAELSDLRESNIQERFDTLSVNAGLLEEIRRNILQASKALNVTAADVPAALEKDLTEVNHKLETLRTSIRSYITQMETSITGASN